jgi:hypothetical protein
MRNAWCLTEADLQVFTESLPTCSVPGCLHRTPNATGICSSHGRAQQTSAQFKGTPKSPEHRAKIAAALKGVSKSPEHRAKISVAKQGQRLGTTAPPAIRSKISTSLRHFFSSPAGELERDRRAAAASRPRPDVAGRNQHAIRTGAPGAWALFNWWMRGGGRGRTRQRWLGRWAPKPGRPRNDARRDYEDALTTIRDVYTETHASERDLAHLTGESRRMVRIALGRRVSGS